MDASVAKWAEVRKRIRKGYTMPASEYKEMMDAFYTQYISDKAGFHRLVPWLERGGRGADGSTNMFLLLLFQSSLQHDVRVARLAMIYKLLTSLHLSPFQAASLLQTYIEHSRMQVTLRVLLDNAEGTLHHLKRYAQQPYQTSLFPSADFSELLLTLRPLVAAA